LCGGDDDFNSERVGKLKNPKVKGSVGHMGWNTLGRKKKNDRFHLKT
jgi:hypothetical protein